MPRDRGVKAVALSGTNPKGADVRLASSFSHRAATGQHEEKEFLKEMKEKQHIAELLSHHPEKTTPPPSRMMFIALFMALLTMGALIYFGFVLKEFITEKWTKAMNQR